jgi:hypothetical protein
MPTERAIQRASWNLCKDQLVHVAPENMQENDDAGVTLDKINLRVDFQTLRRLPLSGAIVFNFKVIFTPLEALREEPYIPSLSRKQLGEGNPRLIAKKASPRMKAIAMDALEIWEEEQVQQGMIPKSWVPETLEESPFYPGWEDDWSKRVGFSI